MRLIDLSPYWLTPELMIFKSPTGRTANCRWLSVKTVPMTPEYQRAALRVVRPDISVMNFVATAPDFIWSIEGRDFRTLTVHEMIEAPTERWRGRIFGGEVINAPD
jgi:hypothetical protein